MKFFNLEVLVHCTSELLRCSEVEQKNNFRALSRSYWRKKKMRHIYRSLNLYSSFMSFYFYFIFRIVGRYRKKVGWDWSFVVAHSAICKHRTFPYVENVNKALLIDRSHQTYLMMTQAFKFAIITSTFPSLNCSTQSTCLRNANRRPRNQPGHKFNTLSLLHPWYPIDWLKRIQGICGNVRQYWDSMRGKVFLFNEFYHIFICSVSTVKCEGTVSIWVSTEQRNVKCASDAMRQLRTKRISRTIATITTQFIRSIYFTKRMWKWWQRCTSEMQIIHAECMTLS